MNMEREYKKELKGLKKERKAAEREFNRAEKLLSKQFTRIDRRIRILEGRLA